MFTNEELFLYKINRNDILGIIKNKSEYKIDGLDLSALELTNDILRELKIKSEQLLRESDRCSKWYDVFLVVLAEDKKAIGLIGFTGLRDGVAELAFNISTDFEGKGYGSEAVRLILDSYQKEECFHTVRNDTVMDTNIASRRVLEKNGFACIDEADEFCVYEKKME